MQLIHEKDAAQIPQLPGSGTTRGQKGDQKGDPRSLDLDFTAPSAKVSIPEVDQISEGMNFLCSVSQFALANLAELRKLTLGFFFRTIS